MSPVCPLVPLWRPRGPVNLGGGGAFTPNILKSAPAGALET
jgi:hypothetical protein